MNPPPLLLAAAIAFWGWQGGHWWLAALVAVLLAGARFFPGRLQLALRDLHRLADLCTGLFVLVAVLWAATEGLGPAVIGVIKWLPLNVLPLFLALAYGGIRQVDLSVVFWSLRRSARASPETAYAGDLGYPYVVLWLLAAAAANTGGAGFYLGLTALAALALWRIRPAGKTPLAWAGALLLAAFVGTAVHGGLYRLQEVIEQSAVDWLSGDGDEDPARTQTSMGHIGQLKLSDKIALQISASPSVPLPFLLRNGSYNLFVPSSASWLVAGDSSFHELPQQRPAQDWSVGGNSVAALEISALSPYGSHVLALPAGAARIGSAAFSRLSRNRLGSINAELAAGRYLYRVAYDPDSVDHTAPEATDLMLPPRDAALLRDQVQRLQLAGKPPQVVLGLLKAHFANHFAYTTVRAGNAAGYTALADFLLRNRRGHCEHFATATVLLLRAAGIPARYATGFSVQEAARFGSGYVARNRHAHAWARVFVDGAWRDFDTTPANWAALEQESASLWEPLLDAWVWLLHRLQQAHLSGYVLLFGTLGLSGAGWFGRKWLRRRGRAAHGAQPRKKRLLAAPVKPAAHDLEWHRVEQYLLTQGLQRGRHETLTDWQQRIAPQIGAAAASGLTEAIRLHYRCRFSRAPSAAERAALRRACADWLAEFGQQNATLRR